MTGAGTSEVAFAIEDTFMGSLVDSDADGNPEYYQPGRNIEISDVELSNALQRLRVPDSAESTESLAQNLEGAFSASWVMSADRVADVQSIVFNDGGTAFAPGRAATSRWFAGIDYLDGVAERELIGVTPTEYSVQYQQNGTIQESLTAVYGDENYGTAITPSSILATSAGQSIPSHGADLSINTVSQTKLQSATLSINNIARFQRGADRKPLDAVIAAPQTTLDIEAVLTETDQLELAYGGGGATTPQDSLTGVGGSFSLSVGGTTVTTYDLSAAKPENYNWNDLASGDNDMTESATLQVNGVSVV